MLGHTRLAIIDLSSQGAQPMRSVDGRFTLVFNGEIFNFTALRSELEAAGCQFRSRSDTEVLLQALVTWGADACTRLRGMFAFALFDKQERTLLLARDRLGIKPLYVARRAGRLAFASEVRALLAAGAVEGRLDGGAVAGYLATGSVPEPHSIVLGVEMLEPGTWLRWGPRGLERRTYWELPHFECRSIQTAEEAVEAIGAEIRTAVRMRLVSDVPLGVFVSGGIDSSAVLALASEHGATQLTAITVALDDRRLDESHFARQVAEHYNAKQVTLTVSAAEAANSIDDAVSALDQPSSDGLNTYFVARATREAGITVALSGLGGDELFAGYTHFRTFQKAMLWRRQLKVASRILPLAEADLINARGRWAKGRAILAAGGDPAKTYDLFRAMFLPNQVAALMPGRSKYAPGSAKIDEPGELLQAATDPINAFSRYELTRYLRNTLLRDADVMSMANALEVRVPLMDHKVVELALAIPGRLKLSRTVNKPLLAGAVSSLPVSVTRRAKQGFALPFDSWFRGNLRPWMEQRLLGEPTRRLGLVDVKAVETTWKAFLRGEQYVSHSRVWTLAVLADWCQRHGVSA